MHLNEYIPLKDINAESNTEENDELIARQAKKATLQSIKKEWALEQRCFA